MLKKIKVKTNKSPNAKKNNLIDSPEDKRFWVCNGETIKNLRELVVSLEKMQESIFQHHVSKEKNDFTNWLNDVFGEKKLAGQLKKLKTAKGMAQRIKATLKI